MAGIYWIFHQKEEAAQKEMALCLGLLNNSSAKCLWFSLCWNPGLCEISGNFSFNPDSWLMCYCYCLTGICSSKELISWYLVHIANKFRVCLNPVPFPQSLGSVTWKSATLSRIVTPRKSMKILLLNDWTKPCWSHIAERTISGYFHFSRFKKSQPRQ